jgi:hypothetical protein
VPPAGGVDCSDFAYQEDAQEVLNGDLTDPFGLDTDHDGLACEDLPNKPIVGGATYEGIVAGGGKIRLTVSPDGKGISMIELIDVVTHCATISHRSTVSPAAPIDLPDLSVFSHTFEAGPPQAPLIVTVVGEFKNSATIAGFIDVTSPTDPQCVDLGHEWVAKVIGGHGAVPPVSPPGRPSSPPAGSGLPSSGSGPLGIDTTNPMSWLIAGLIGAGLAWLASGIAGAGFSLVTSAGTAGTMPVEPSPQEDRRRQSEQPTMNFRTRHNVPTWRRRTISLGSPPDAVDPDRFQAADWS